MQRQPETLTPDLWSRTLENAARQVTRITGLVEDLLDVARIRAGKLRLELDDTDLGCVVREVCDRLAEPLRLSGCSVTLDLEETVIGRWDPTRCEQVLVNLITNAMKYAPGPLRITLRRDGAQARLCVEDRGPGIAPAHQALIFERFERASASRSLSGLGLGLFIARQIVEALGGAIKLQSAEGTGATFIVELPLGHAAEVARISAA
jgi:signal transduction histidine kinase